MRQVLLGFCLGLFAITRAWGQAERLPAAVPAEQPVAAPASPGCPGDLFCCDEGGAGGWQARVTADYLMMWVRSGPTPPLVTGGPVVTGNPATSSGALNGPMTAVVFGDAPLNYGTFAGGRWTADGWLESAGVGLQLSGFLLEHRSVGFATASDAGGNPIVARPFYDVLNNVPSALFVAYPGALSGGVAVASSTHLWGLESNLTGLSLGGAGLRGRLLAGFRYLDLTESLGVTQRSTVLPNGTAFLNDFVLNTGDTLVLSDAFHTRNQFYGGQVGFEGEWGVGRLIVGTTAKVALGATHEVVQVQGTSLLFAAGGSGIADSAAGGALAQDTNLGRTHKNAFAVVPEVDVKVSYRLTDNVLASLGYTFMYVSDVVRPGRQIDTGINVGHVPSSEAFGLFPTPARPAPLCNHSDFWAQGLSLGLELRF